MILQHIVSVCFCSFIFIFFCFCRPSNKWHFLVMSKIRVSQKCVIVLALFSTILISVAPMSLSPYWNGSVKVWADKQQYARMADSLLQGHLYIDKGDIDPMLEAMVNPYDRAEREKLGVRYNWDEAYYNHHYYMYFGVVPTLVLFIPFKIFTGTDLQSYQATQVFAALTVLGLFYLFYLLSVYFFPKFPFSLYLILSSGFSIISIGYSIAAPGLYCTAIVSGICFMVWGIISFFKGLWLENNESVIYRWLFLGALSGALALGCRPPVGLANLIIIILIYKIIKAPNNSKYVQKKKIIILLLPYIIVGLALMCYNYARFDNVFEFGQSYQLTVADQHNYGSFLTHFYLRKTIVDLLANFYIRYPLTESFPFIQYNGVFINFPLLLLSVRIFSKDIAQSLKIKKLYDITFTLFMIPLIVTVIDSYWSPFLIERYRLDFYYLLCIVCFICIATWLEQVTETGKEILISFIVFLTFAAFVVEFLFFCLPYEGSYTDVYPDILEEIYKGLCFGLNI